MTLVEFLKARLDEDEQAAQAVRADDWTDHDGWIELAPEVAEHARAHDPARVLREVEAKRRIIRAHAKWCAGQCEAKYPHETFDAAHWWSLKALAEVYADHPDYPEEWRA